MSYANKTKEQLIAELEKLKKQLAEHSNKKGSDNITKNKIGDDQLRFKSIFDNSTIGLFKSTPDGKILMANSTLLKMLGYDNLNELTIHQFEHNSPYHDKSREKFRKQMVKKGKITGFETLWPKKDGSLINVRINAVAFFDKNNTISHYEGAVEDITEYTNTLNSLRESEEILRNIFISSPYAISLIDLQGNIMDCNLAKEKLFGYKKKELIGKSVHIFYPDYEKDKVEKLLEKILKKGFVESNEFTLKKKDGSTFIAEFSCSVIKDEKGNPDSIISITNDITCRKKAEEQIKSSEEKYRLLFEHMLNGLMLFEIIYNKKGEPVDGRYIEVNALFEKIFGIKKDYIIGKTQTEIFGFVDPELIIHLSEVLNNKKPVHFEYQLKSVDRILDIYAYIPKEGQIACIFNDITDKKLVERALVFEKNLLEAFMNNTVDHVYFKDLESKFIKVNKAWAKSRASNMGSDPDKVVGLSDFDFFSKKIAEQTFKDEKSIIESRRPLVQKIEIRPGKKNRNHYISTTKMPYFDEDGNLAGTFGISRDITSLIEFEKSLQKSEKELQELNATKDKFFSIVAHDLKNPFGSIINFANLLLSNLEKLDEEKLKKYVTAIFETSKQGFNLLENLLEWSRSQTGKIVYNPIKVSINSLVSANISLIEHTAAKKEISIQNNLDKNLIGFADPNMISTVIRNLLSNAVKFTGNKGKIRIFNTIKKGIIEIHFQDTGVGIPKDDLPKLFRIDEDFSTRGTDNEKGTGLGLIIAREFVTRNKGEIKVTSIEGTGSTFSFSIPEKE